MTRPLVRKSVRDLHAYTPGEQPRGGGWTKLNTNENPYPPSRRVIRALLRFDSPRLRLYPDPMSTELRKRIAALHGCSPDQVFAGNGSDEVLALCTKAFVEDNGSIGFFTPSYSLYPVLAAMRCVRSKPVELAPDFTWRMPVKYRASLFFMANPNAPTGMLFDHVTVESFCRSFPGVVVIDEAYADFADRNCIDLAMELGNVLVVRTMSKSYSLAGIRLGYAVGPRELIGALFKLKDSYNVNALTQAVALEAIRDRRHMLKNVEEIVATRNRLAAALERRGFKVYPSQANFLWVQPPKPGSRRLFKALRRHRVLVRHFEGPATGDFLRITVGDDDDATILLVAVDAILRPGNRELRYGL